MKKEGFSSQSETISIAEIPPEFVVWEGKIGLMVAGKIEAAFQGCACTTSDIVGDFIRRLSLNSTSESLLVDFEAGVESFGRGVERHVDVVLIVVEPSRESILLAKRAAEMARGMGVERVCAVANKVPSPAVGATLFEELRKMDLEVVGAVAQDTAVFEAGMVGAVPV